ncbi:gliding motility-associated C-terminal domain-containing protein [Subsaximicrobium wynnwilliamsii]|uniref:Gliding motility-associated C-terminal domain-containing protein n=1 Tax=Subsaximicrobium wynnwilliamsii TaxID=291179 RepID=A0A5C6ZCA5_9FLAO|nr:gliding motility-associated C-terminal domain-containing protein [Subsaximicrobium wynnwilliamsii]TXD81421.1 gliding motility-associated C-terminal domain-containing protein [Subsaximicrobium wynnwilliamsii]TXD87137.1 gliding motility-associated C-terminal domain-containing protein [Subsaximicrobium wynnwilliamsii]TXE00691.1 gliding motility-associated C-terminal domain-containing protein [Subsaximicrobium wynnwilliamsii]
MQKTTNLNRLLCVLCLIAVSITAQLNAQIVIGAPNLGFSQACASSTFNSYSATFVFSPASALGDTNQFIIEMSNEEGDFTDPTIVFTSQPNVFTTSPATINFSLPSTTSGEAYKIRVKSTAPAATSSRSAAFAAYYKIQDSPFSINNLVETGAFCSGGSYLLTIDNPGSGENDSPLNYPSLTYNWFKETGPTTSVFVAEGNTLNVTQEGTYFVKTNYGTCTSSSFSNRVSISEAVSGEASASITSSLGSPFCPDQGMTTLSTISGLGYQWFKDGVAIPDAIEQTYQTDASGLFAVQVDLGSCQASGAIDLVSESFEGSLNVSEVNEIEEGESLEVTVSTTAQNPTYVWYFNDTLIPGATSDTYTASAFGAYSVLVSQSAGCVATNTFPFEITEAMDPFPEVANIPNLISPNGDGINDTWVIPLQYVDGTDTEVMIMDNRGKIVLQTKAYLNNWPEDQLDLNSINQVYYYILTTPDNKTKKGSITLVK